ncbi:tetratricopeptide repeat protein [Salsuginibacillus kocurii]|uniref:tetratricopeptide repeat protein n=1 Tax=Salsuginibacillus kocurii TaxID=427078 RepID=UPI00037064C1|nr:tetratricopeptide repeat protein [Salsuginibacillus kocurii]
MIKQWVVLAGLFISVVGVYIVLAGGWINLNETSEEDAIEPEDQEESTAVLNYMSTGEIEELVEKEPDHLNARLHLGFHYIEQGMEAEALGQYEQAVQVDGQNRNAWLGLGRAQLKMENFAEALEAREQAVQVAPDYQAHVQYAEILLLEDLEKAKAQAVKAKEHVKRSNPEAFIVPFIEGIEVLKEDVEKDPFYASKEFLSSQFFSSRSLETEFIERVSEQHQLSEAESEALHQLR